MILNLLTALLLLLSPPKFHSNVVAELRLDNFENELFLEASLDKRMLAVALMSEADCPPKEMLPNCGSQYLIDHFEILINGKVVSLQKQAMEIRKDQVVFRYYLGDMNEKIHLVEARSDYMIEYHEHSELKLNVVLYDTFRQYSLNVSRPKMKMHLS
ncbi:MAG: hypothetical protein RIC35_08045 [Marinoscillum sp.]